jgi:hypothetical protein
MHWHYKYNVNVSKHVAKDNTEINSNMSSALGIHQQYHSPLDEVLFIKIDLTVFALFSAICFFFSSNFKNEAVMSDAPVGLK